MIKFAGTRNGKPLMGIGLSVENVKRLQAGQPIIFDATALGFDGEVLILAGETEWEMAATVAPLLQGLRGWEEIIDPDQRA